MSDSITVVGTVATAPRHVKTDEQLEVTTFRLASSHRRYDRKTQKWVDGETNWYTIVAFRQLAGNAAQSISKGDRVIAFGRPRVRDWSSGERSGTVMEVEVDSLGHDLLWGRTAYTKTSVRRDVDPDAASADDSAAEAPGDAPDPAGSESGAEPGAPAPVADREPAPAF